MKKLLCLILAWTFLLSFAACAPVDDPIPSESSSIAPESTEEPAQPTETTPQIPFLKIKGVDISEYSIIYYTEGNKNENVQSVRLAEHFYSVFDKEIEILPDDEGKHQYAIIITDTLPSVAKDHTIDLTTSLIIGEDGIIWIVASNAYTLEIAVDKLIADSMPPEADSIIDLDYSGDNAVSVKAEDLGEILKVMSYNVKTGSVARSRCEEVMKNITDFMPDTIGTQEINHNWITLLKLKKFFEEYEMVGKPRDVESDLSAGNEYSAIFYRKSTLTLVDSGTYWLSDTPTVVGSKHESSDYTRIMTFAVFERKSDGTRFIHVNTHMEWDHKDVKTNLIQMKILLELVDTKIYEKHGELPTFFTGDFNVSMTSDGYKHLLSTGKEDSRVVAETTTDENTFSGGSIIDYCIVTKGDFIVSSFDVGHGKPGSDHYPVYVEMYITPQK